MNPSNPGFNLPPPVDNQANQVSGAPEAATTQPEQVMPAPQAQPAVAPPQFVMPGPVASSAAQPTVTTTALAVIPDDQDLIEKEWVNKAKQIVEANRDDPYKQSEQLTEFKADYLQKRYNKSIKVGK